jgi:DNA-binding NarL/FixJ family response regulator
MNTVVVAHRFRLLREGICEFLSADCTIAVVGEAPDGLEAVRLARSLSPDVIVLDAVLPCLNGLDAIVEIQRDAPGTRVLLLLAPEDAPRAAAALRAGASGLVLTTGPLADLVSAIERVCKGGRHLSPGLAEHLIEDVARGKGESSSALTHREREVLQLVSEGGSTREIAGRLHISPRTVEVHRRRVMAKLGLRSLPDLTKYAIRNRITSLDP